MHRFKGFIITGEKSEFSGDLAPEGYPFFAGAFELTKTFFIETLEPRKRYVLTFPVAEAIVIIATVNGKQLPAAAWSPWEIDVTGALRTGENTLSLTLVNSLRNLLGPHHYIGGELIAVGPVPFTGRSGWPSPRGGEDNWYDVRKNGKTKTWCDDYHHIGFGLLEPPLLGQR